MFERRLTDLTVKLILKDRRWIVTFIQELRIDSSNESAYHSAGYVSTGEAWRRLSRVTLGTDPLHCEKGFWAGLTIVSIDT
jgi:hypothetical protein